MIDLICTVIAFACAVALATLCSRLRKENERLRDEFEEELTKARMEAKTQENFAKAWEEEYLRRQDARENPIRYDIADYGTSFRVTAVGDGKWPLCVGFIHEYEYDQGDEASRAYARMLAEELVEKLQEQAI